MSVYLRLITQELLDNLDTDGNKIDLSPELTNENNYHIDTPALDKFDEEHGITWRKPIIKDE